MRSAAAVESAIAEYDQLGQDAFLRRYGFGRAKHYRLIHNGRDYDSKAIVGVAHGYEFPAEGPLRSSDFSGGVHGAAKTLRELGFEVVSDGGETPRSDLRTTQPRVATVAPTVTSVELGASTPTAVLVGCVKLKGSQPAPARELYTSDLFRKRRRYAEATGRPWYILSALHGLVLPADVLAPYDMALSDQPAAYRAAWGERVVAALLDELPDVEGATFEVHAGAAYSDAISAPLRRHGAMLQLPLRGLAQGQQLQWYLRTPPPRQPVAVPAGPTVDEVVAVLGDPVRARPVIAFPWGEVAQQQPGLYSWWVGEPGAAALSRGLGHEVAPGLVYAGQAGATTSRARVERSATLASRIGGNHLRGRITSSTWRLTLAASLRDELELDFGLIRRRDSEARLTAWMTQHLRLVTFPVPQRDLLAVLEEGVLDVLDPPLNLQGRGPSAARRAVSAARKQVGGL